MTPQQRLRDLAARTGLDGIAEEMLAVADELDALLTPRPPETAPRDGTVVLGFDWDAWIEMHWCPRRERWVDFDERGVSLKAWLPLPPAPQL